MLNSKFATQLGSLLVFLFAFCKFVANSVDVPTIEWDTLDLKYPYEKFYVGVEVYNNTLFGIGGHRIETSQIPLTVFYIDVEDLLNYDGSQQWSSYEWKDDNSTGVTVEYGNSDSFIYMSTRIDNLIYITGWETPLSTGNDHDEMIIFDAAHLEQVPLNTFDYSIPDSGFGPCGTNNGTHVFIIGGRDRSTEVTTGAMRIYNTLNNEWTLGPSMNVPRLLHNCEFDEINNVIWVFNGVSQVSPALALRTVEYYSFETDSWAVIDQANPYARGWTDSLLFQYPEWNINFAFVMGGIYPGRWADDTTLFDIRDGDVSESEFLDYATYSQVSDLPLAVGGFMTRYLPEYDVIDVSYEEYPEESNYLIESKLLQKRCVFIGGYINNIDYGDDSIHVGVITYTSTNLVPAFVSACSTDPCNCGQFGEMEIEDELCSVCGIDGCEVCAQSSFRAGSEYPCANCQDTFGMECNWCRDFVGCMGCRPGYTRTLNEPNNLYYCERSDFIDQQEYQYRESMCVTDNCVGESNPFCDDVRPWGCAGCQNGYFRRNNDYPCVNCNIIPNCLECESKKWGGCRVCANGYQPLWDFAFGYRRCFVTS